MKEFQLLDRFRRPDGKVIILETRMPDGTWGADMLEDADGQPDPHGDLCCYGLIVTEADLAIYTPLPCPTRASLLSDAIVDAVSALARVPDSDLATALPLTLADVRSYRQHVAAEAAEQREGLE